MLQKNEVRAGIMLYALLMVSIFSLLLQFYLNRQVSLARINQASEKALVAYLMADWTRDKFVRDRSETDSNQDLAKESEESSKPAPERKSDKEGALPDAEVEEVKPGGEAGEDSEDENVSVVEELSSGSLGFKQGRTSYQYKEGYLAIKVHLKAGGEFDYLFLIDSEKP